jgi:2-oxoglutarate dehydrogenase E2 component (dihydrolipoamide succinyltransferase)
VRGVELVTMPQLGETVTEGTITRWVKQVGEAIAADDVLFEVSTDKVDTEVPSAGAGFLRRVLVAEGETVPVGTVLAVVTDTADEPLDPPVAEPVDGEPSGDGAPRPASEAVPDEAGAPTREPVSTAAPGRGAAPERGGAVLTPVVRRLLAEHGLQPDDVVGSGRDGRITRADVLATVANGGRPPRTTVAAGPSPASASPGASAAPAVATPAFPEPWPDDELVELSRARRATAEHMRRSLDTSAHTLVVVEVDYAGLASARAASGLSYLPYVARAVCDALVEFPHLNATLGRDHLHLHRRVNLGVAVDVGSEALVVPVVHDAGALRVRALADRIADLAARARSKRLTGDDLAGGTFSITNVGAYGTVVTAPVINQPQVAILSTDGVRMRPVAVRAPAGDWVIAVHPIGNLSLSFDHRAVDGAYASAFLARVRTLLETVDWSAQP